MRIKDVERLLASHAELVGALERIRIVAVCLPSNVEALTVAALDRWIAEARKLREQIARPL